MFKLTIETGSAAFSQEYGSGELELARILRVAADKLEYGHSDGKLLDVNGNTVGSFEYTQERDA